MIYDFHTHTFLSDGVLSPMELVRRAVFNGYSAIAITDHCGLEDQERIIPLLVKECAIASEHLGVLAIPGVELTHLPPNLINEAAKRAKKMGAQIVIVHGESIVEPVAPGTNRAAIESTHVDVLAHPGLITEEEARLAGNTGTFLELSARRGHSLTNGLVAQRGLLHGARLLVNSDAHAPEDLLTETLARDIVLGSGVMGTGIPALLQDNPRQLVDKLPINSF
jgi:putative hydrolase